MTAKLLLANLVAESGVTVTGTTPGSGNKVPANLIDPDIDLTYGSTAAATISLASTAAINGYAVIHGATSGTLTVDLRNDSASRDSNTHAANAASDPIINFLSSRVTGVTTVRVSGIQPISYVVAGQIVEPSIPPIVGQGISIPIQNAPIISPTGKVFTLYNLPRRSGRVTWRHLTHTEANNLYNGAVFSLNNKSPIVVSLFDGDSNRQSMGRFVAQIVNMDGPTNRGSGEWSVSFELLEVR